MVIKNVSLDIVCGITSKIPDTGRPEVAFAGKSNVGKSSLINGLMNRKALARTSAQPGKTQTINFYNINEAMYLVDLPGYGYAKVSAAEKEKWGKMIEGYLHNSKELRAVFLLVDIRHKPSANDKQMYDWICHNGYEPVIIATKLDKLKRSGKKPQGDPYWIGPSERRKNPSFFCRNQAGKRRDMGTDRRVDRTC